MKAQNEGRKPQNKATEAHVRAGVVSVLKSRENVNKYNAKAKGVKRTAERVSGPLLAKVATHISFPSLAKADGTAVLLPLTVEGGATGLPTYFKRSGATDGEKQALAAFEALRKRNGKDCPKAWAELLKSLEGGSVLYVEHDGERVPVLFVAGPNRNQGPKGTYRVANSFLLAERKRVKAEAVTA